MNPYSFTFPCPLGTKIYCEHPKWGYGYGAVVEYVLHQDMFGRIAYLVYIDWKLQACPNPMTLDEFRRYCVEDDGRIRNPHSR